MKSDAKKQIQLLVVDLGSQYTKVIGRTLREIGFRSAILSSQKAEKWLKNNKPKGIILSGGSASVYDKNAPDVPKNIFKNKTPILGICYGMQFIANKFGGKVLARQEKKEYGRTIVNFSDDKLFTGINKNRNIVWASHGDSVAKMPKGFKIIAESQGSKTIAGMANGKNIWALQFHPEVTHSKNGKDILSNFTVNICNCIRDWEPKDIIDEIRQEVILAVSGKRSIIGFSGGVDSTTLSGVLSKALGENLLALCIDTGGLRQNEIEEIKINAKAAGVKRFKIVRATKRFQKAIGKTTHSELKRKNFKKIYGRILEEEAKKFGAEFIVQGTLATDEIESGKAGEATLIKSHHNVGLNLNVKELHPFRNLFKYEVRDLAIALGFPESISQRQPFPGPGLYVRVIGKPPTIERLAILKWADAEVTGILRKHKIYDDISQLVVALACLRTVGIKGDGRVYESSIIVRAVKTLDFMTVAGYIIPEKVRMEITESVTKHPKIVRVFYDETNKPPATTELE